MNEQGSKTIYMKALSNNRYQNGYNNVLEKSNIMGND
jgi:hypothetical protein